VLHDEPHPDWRRPPNTIRPCFCSPTFAPATGRGGRHWRWCNSRRPLSAQRQFCKTRISEVLFSIKVSLLKYRRKSYFVYPSHILANNAHRFHIFVILTDHLIFARTAYFRVYEETERLKDNGFIPTGIFAKVLVAAFQLFNPTEVFKVASFTLFRSLGFFSKCYLSNKIFG